MIDWILSNYTMIIVIVGTVLLAMASGAIGTLTVLRKQALVGDALSHSTLLGVVMAFMLTNSKDMLVLLIGATISAFLAMFILDLIKKFSKVKYDAGLALILAGFFGLGQVLLIAVQDSGDAAQAGLNKFIFGQAATMLINDVIVIGAISISCLLLIFIFWKEFKLFIFNREHFQSLGFPVWFINSLLTILSVIIIVIGIRTVGIILMSALLIIPSVAARQWSNHLGINVILASIFGMIAGAIGTYISASTPSLPTGPVIVMILSLIVLLSLLFAPKRGIVQKLLQDKKHQKLLMLYKPLIHIYSENEMSLYTSDDLNQFVLDGYLIKQNETFVLSPKGVALTKKLLRGDLG